MDFFFAGFAALLAGLEAFLAAALTGDFFVAPLLAAGAAFFAVTFLAVVACLTTLACFFFAGLEALLDEFFLLFAAVSVDFFLLEPFPNTLAQPSAYLPVVPTLKIVISLISFDLLFFRVKKFNRT